MHRRDLLCAGLVSAFSLPLPVRSASAVAQWDVLVVGAGGAGLAAAVSALESGAKRVAVLEKMPMIGGHTIISTGSYSIPVSLAPEDDPFEQMAQEIVESGGNEALALKLASESMAGMQWLAGMGVNWEPRLFRAVGSQATRNISTGSARGGYDYVQALNRRAKRLGAVIFFSTRATDLVLDAGRVIGVDAETKESQTKRFLARAVVLATGGFGANVALRMRYIPWLDATYRTTADPFSLLGDCATGDGIELGERAGAKLVDMEAMQLIPFNGGRVLDFVGGELWVNSRGVRFVDEGASFETIRLAMGEQPGRMMWAITDAKSKKNASLGPKMAAGIVRTADSIEKLAEGTGIPSVVLRETLSRYNRFAQAGKDDDFGKTVFTQTVDTPPFYYGVEKLAVHMTSGGLAIDDSARVLDQNNRPIPGLWAAGETTGGLHGRNRLGGNALTDTFVFGRIAGREAAQSVSRKIQ